MSFLEQLTNALRRAVTLPKSKNSLSDVLGADVAAAVSATVHSLLADAVTSALTALATNAVKDIAHVQDFLTTTVTHTLTNVSPALASSINDAIKAGTENVEGVALSDVAKIGSSVLAELAKVVKV